MTLGQLLLLCKVLPRRLKNELPGHDVSTVVECGWSGVTNGKLLALAAADFDVFLTADQKLQFQQNLAALPISVIVLGSSNSPLESLRLLIPEILASLVRLQPRSLVRVGDQSPESQLGKDVS